MHPLRAGTLQVASGSNVNVIASRELRSGFFLVIDLWAIASGALGLQRTHTSDWSGGETAYRAFGSIGRLEDWDWLPSAPDETGEVRHGTFSPCHMPRFSRSLHGHAQRGLEFASAAVYLFSGGGENSDHHIGIF